MVVTTTRPSRVLAAAYLACKAHIPPARQPGPPSLTACNHQCLVLRSLHRFHPAMPSRLTIVVLTLRKPTDEGAIGSLIGHWH